MEKPDLNNRASQDGAILAIESKLMLKSAETIATNPAIRSNLNCTATNCYGGEICLQQTEVVLALTIVLQEGDRSHSNKELFM